MPRGACDESGAGALGRRNSGDDPTNVRSRRHGSPDGESECGPSSPYPPEAQAEGATLTTVVVDGIRFVHPIYVGGGPRYNVLRAALAHVNGTPKHRDDVTFTDCVAEYGAAVCPCGHFALTWADR